MTKYAMHALRIAYQGIELMTLGKISLPVAEPARAHLMAVLRADLPEESDAGAVDGRRSW